MITFLGGVMPIPQYSIAKVLNDTYTNIVKKNQHYSIRAFARDLDMSAGSLSQILNGKRRISKNMTLRISKKLSLSEKVDELLEPFNQEENVKKIKYKELSEEQYSRINDWYFFAILSMLELDDFRADTSFISKRLGVEEAKIKLAINTLVEEGILFWTQNGGLERRIEKFSTTDGVRSKYIRESHKKNLELAYKKIDSVDVDLRDFTAMTLPIEVARLPEVIKMIRAFYKEVNCFLEGGEKEEIYKLCVQLFPLTEKK